MKFLAIFLFFTLHGDSEITPIRSDECNPDYIPENPLTPREILDSQMDDEEAFLRIQRAGLNNLKIISDENGNPHHYILSKLIDFAQTIVPKDDISCALGAGRTLDCTLSLDKQKAHCAEFCHYVHKCFKNRQHDT